MMPLSYTSLKGIFRRRSIPTCSFHLIAATVLSFRHSYIRWHNIQDQILQVVIINFLRSFLWMRQHFLFCPRSAVHIMQQGLHMDSTQINFASKMFLVFWFSTTTTRQCGHTLSLTVKFFWCKRWMCAHSWYLSTSRWQDLQGWSRVLVWTDTIPTNFIYSTFHLWEGWWTWLWKSPLLSWIQLERIFVLVFHLITAVWIHGIGELPLLLSERNGKRVHFSFLCPIIYE